MYKIENKTPDISECYFYNVREGLTFVLFQEALWTSSKIEY